MRTQTVTTDEDQRVTFIELFFDLVFVYAVTQLVALLHHELGWRRAGRPGVLAGVVGVDTVHVGVELGRHHASGG
jgi:low temperature requirement protein LtrA